jgi:dTDP-4-amino-4,6-dideoxygalactose transaminase
MADKIWKVPLSDLQFGDEEDQAVLQVLHSRWLTMGTITSEFERRFAEEIYSKHAVAVTNATAALHLACLSLGIGEGDEIILPSLSFVATANAVLYCGATVRFADIIGPEELTISPQSIEDNITPKTKAIIVMHYAGYPCRMNEILEIAEQHKLALIEDAAHAPGAALNGKSMGTWGDIGCFSFFSNKNLVTGEGGMLVSNQDDLAERARLLRSHAMTSLTLDRHLGHAFSYDVVDLGYNYRIDEMRSALGLVGLEQLGNNNARRETITRAYWRGLSDSNLGLPFKELDVDKNISTAYHIFPILLPSNINRNAFMNHLRVKGIQTSIHYPPIHKFSYYKNRFKDISLPNTERIASHQVTLPLFSSMNDEQLDLVINTVREALEESSIYQEIQD